MGSGLDRNRDAALRRTAERSVNQSPTPSQRPAHNSRTELVAWPCDYSRVRVGPLARPVRCNRIALFVSGRNLSGNLQQSQTPTARSEISSPASGVLIWRQAVRCFASTPTLLKHPAQGIDTFRDLFDNRLFALWSSLGRSPGRVAAITATWWLTSQGNPAGRAFRPVFGRPRRTREQAKSFRFCAFLVRM